MASFYSASRPTPTTAFYTVRSSKPPATLAARVLFYILVAVRLACGAFFIWLIFSKWSRAGGSEVCSRPAGSGVVCTLERAARDTPWLSLLPVCVVGFWIAIRRGYVEETLLVLRGMGLQTSTSSWAYLVPPVTRFIPTTSVQDIFIHEAFKGFEVRYYLAVIVEGEEDAHVVFPALLPKRGVLEEVWRGARDCLYEPKT